MSSTPSNSKFYLENGTKEAQIAQFPTYREKSPLITAMENMLLYLPVDEREEEKVLNLLKMDPLDLTADKLSVIEKDEVLATHMQHLLSGLRVRYIPSPLEDDIHRIRDLLNALLNSSAFDLPSKSQITPSDSSLFQNISQQTIGVRKAIDRILSYDYGEHLPDNLFVAKQKTERYSWQGSYAQRLLDLMSYMAEDPLFAQSPEYVQMHTLHEIGKTLGIYNPEALSLHVLEVGKLLQEQVQSLKDHTEIKKEHLVKVLEKILSFTENLQSFHLLPANDASLMALVDTVLIPVRDRLRLPEWETTTSYFSIQEYHKILVRLEKVGLVTKKYYDHPQTKEELLDQLSAYYTHCEENFPSQENAVVTQHIFDEFTYKKFFDILSLLKSLKWITPLDLINCPGVSEKTAEIIVPELLGMLTEERRMLEPYKKNTVLPVAPLLTKSTTIDTHITAHKNASSLLTTISNETLHILGQQGLLGISTTNEATLGEHFIKFAGILIELRNIYAERIAITPNMLVKNIPAESEESLIKIIKAYESLDLLCTDFKVDRIQSLQQKMDAHQTVDSILSRLFDTYIEHRHAHLETLLVQPKQEDGQALQQAKELTIAHYTHSFEESRTYLSGLIKRWYENARRIAKHEELFENSIHNQLVKKDGQISEHSTFTNFSSRISDELCALMSKNLHFAQYPEHIRGHYSIPAFLHEIFGPIDCVPSADILKIFFANPMIAQKAFQPLEAFNKETITDKDKLSLDAMLAVMRKFNFINEDKIIEQSLKNAHATINNAIHTMQPSLQNEGIYISYKKRIPGRIASMRKLISTPKLAVEAEILLVQKIEKMLTKEFESKYVLFLEQTGASKELLHSTIKNCIEQYMQEHNKNIQSIMDTYEQTFAHYNTPWIRFIVRIYIAAQHGGQRIPVLTKKEKNKIYFDTYKAILQQTFPEHTTQSIVGELEKHNMQELLPKKNFLQRK